MPDAIPMRGDSVRYVLPSGRRRTALVLAVAADGALTLAVFKESPSDFALPPNAIAPEVLMGHESHCAVTTVGGVRAGSAPGQWGLVNAAPAQEPIAPASVIERPPALAEPQTEPTETH